jgi:hypothetical protein
MHEHPINHKDMSGYSQVNIPDKAGNNRSYYIPKATKNWPPRLTKEGE